MVSDQVFAQLGVSGSIVAILLYILKELWADNKALREQNHEDQKAVLPALTAASAAMAEFTRVAARLVERE